jgi:two-component system NtrC family sensor kinase
MKENSKTKAELIEELTSLRRRLARNEKRTNKSPKSGKKVLRPPYEKLLIHSSTPTFALDSNHRVILWNRTCEELTGIRAADVLGTDTHWKAFYEKKRPFLADIIIDENIDDLGRYYASYSLSDIAISSEGFFENLGGLPRYIVFDATPVYDEKGDIIAAVETIHDISLLKKTEEALKASKNVAERERAKADAIIAALGDGVSIQGRDFKVLYQNQAHREIVGGDMRGQYCYQAYSGNLATCENCPVDSAFKTGKIQKKERSLIVDGQAKHIAITASPLRDTEGNIIAGIEVVRDVTDRKVMEDELNHHRVSLVELVEERTSELHKLNESLQREILSREVTEQGLRESEERFRNIYAESPIGIQVYDGEGILVDANRACLDIFGLGSVDDARKFRLFEDPNLSAEAKAGLTRGETARYEAAVDFEKMRRQGLYPSWKSGVAYRDVLITPLGMSDGKGAKGFLVQIQDITERKELEQQLRQAQKMEDIGKLAGGIAHDFNNIISAISNFAYLLEIKMPEDEPAREYALRIRAASERAGNLTHSLLAFSRKQVMNPRPVDLNEIVSTVEKLFSRLIGEDIELNVFPEEGALTVLADSSQMEQVLMNLATNARDAMPEGGLLNITTRLTGPDSALSPALDRKYALVTITDSGVGMDETTREHIFEPFFTTKEVGKGTGLGLSIVYGIIKQHGGFIEVESEPGEGTTFRIYLPLVDSKIEVVGTEAVAIPSGDGETVLIAEDDAEVRLVTKNILEEFGYRVLEASDGEDAVRMFRQHRDEIHVIIMDLVMPKKTGVEAYKEIKALGDGVEVLFVSGYATEISRKKALLQDDVQFISKPVSPREILIKVREALGPHA